MRKKVAMRRADREIRDSSEMIDILKRGDVCHIALVDGTEPYLVTLNYGFSWHSHRPTLYFHCADAGRKMEILRKNPRACFSVDTDHVVVRGVKACNWGMKYRSVVGYGDIQIVEDAAEREEGLRLLMEQYSHSQDCVFESKILASTKVLKLEADEITGKKKT
ncbi:MAG: pyridoxamine 5'-phosphate oxidase family protein [Acidobacteria bacterium]|nr:pyridoxamine 5'-phosphate oxidase family protein [Acidobacteriota bacterium]